MREADRIATRQQERDWFIAALEASDKVAQEEREIDREVLENYMVLPPTNGYRGRTSLSGNAVMADPETHQIIETLLAMLMLSVVGEAGFVGSEPKGREDAFASSLVNQLIERSTRNPGNYRALYVFFKNFLLFGSSLVLPFWKYRTGQRLETESSIDIFTGEETIERSVQERILSDDVSFMPLDLDDVRYDPSHDTPDEWLYAARRFIIPKYQAKLMADNEEWDAGQTRVALGSPPSKKTEDGYENDQDRERIDRPQQDDMPEVYHPVVGWEMFAEVPYKPKDGVRHRRLVMINNRLVLSEPQDSGLTRTVPMFEAVVNPIQGRFRGVSPGATARFTQDYTNGLLMCLSDATVKKLSTPIAYNKRARPDLRLLREWRGPIPVDGDPNNLKELNFDVSLGEGAGLLQALKQQMKDQSGAQAGVQGQGLGSKRFSATESQLTFQQQLSRPEMMSSLLEREYMPNLGRATLELYQSFIDSREDLARRAGAANLKDRTPFVSDILGDFDIEFIGSRRMQSKELQLQFLERAFQVFGSIPGAAPLFPWGDAMAKWLEKADLRELEEMVANPDGVEGFIDRTLQSSQNQATGNNNGAGASLGPSGLAPAQAAGRAI